MTTHAITRAHVHTSFNTHAHAQGSNCSGIRGEEQGAGSRGAGASQPRMATWRPTESINRPIRAGWRSHELTPSADPPMRTRFAAADTSTVMPTSRFASPGHPQGVARPRPFHRLFGRYVLSHAPLLPLDQPLTRIVRRLFGTGPRLPLNLRHALGPRRRVPLRESTLSPHPFLGVPRPQIVVSCEVGWSVYGG